MGWTLTARPQYAGTCSSAAISETVSSGHLRTCFCFFRAGLGMFLAQSSRIYRLPRNGREGRRPRKRKAGSDRGEAPPTVLLPPGTSAVPGNEQPQGRDFALVGQNRQAIQVTPPGGQGGGFGAEIIQNPPLTSTTAQDRPVGSHSPSLMARVAAMFD